MSFRDPHHTGLVRAVFLALLATGIILTASLGSAAETKPKSFSTPEVAVKELMEAAKAGDSKALLAILGPEAAPIVESGDAVADKGSRERFLQAYQEASKIERSGNAKAILSVGKDAWPFPIPIVKSAAGWHFDTKQGAEEILNRRIGRNELAAMQVLQAYVDAQREYYRLNPQKDTLPHFAQHIASTEGKRDGLYWAAKTGESPSPLGPLVASAAAEGYTKSADGKPGAYHGYHYRILREQGPAAKGGAYDYVAQGRMIGGFAMVAYPAGYGSSGVMTFIVNHDGAVYEKDLGPDTATAASKMTQFNPDKTWKRTK